MSEKRCSLCGALRINGACSLLGCRDPLFDQREEDKIAAAEERGRRRGVEERDELRELLKHAAQYVAWHGVEDKRAEGLFARIDAALAPRAQASDGPPCAECKHEKFWHQWSGKKHAFCCAPVGGDYCGCKNYLAPRDSAPIPAGDWRKERDAADDKLIAELRAPRDSGKEKSDG